MKKLLTLILSIMALTVSAQSRFRVIIDNDLGGDPDGLFQLAHQVHLLRWYKKFR